MKGRDKIIQTVVTTARILFGITFIFSGFVKAVDPLGFKYKIEDYLISFQFSELIPLALTVAIALILLELVLGVLIILGIYRKWTSVFALLFMIVMTPLTLYIALANPVKDCGCFGDALIISNWNTFYKNIVLLAFAIILLVFHRRISPFYSNKTKPYVLIFVILFFLAFSFYNIIYLPVLDFRPYKVGSNITEKMGDNNTTEGDVYQNIYVYEKDGIKKEFTEENYPWEDSTWTFVDLKTDLVKEGEKPEIQDFAIIAYQKDSNGLLVKTNDITQDVLSEPVSILVVSTPISRIKAKQLKQIQSLADYAASNSIDMHIVTASDENAVACFNERMGETHLNYASMDELTLKTIIRSNPGVVLLKEGAVQAKWSKNNIPDAVKLSKVFQARLDTKSSSNNNSAPQLLILCIVFVLPLLGIKWYDRKYLNTYRHK